MACKAKFSDEELSRILSAHSAVDLRGGGGVLGVDDDYGVCVLQAVNGYGRGWTSPLAKRFGSRFRLSEIINWFDRHYDIAWTSEQFLAELEARGLA